MAVLADELARHPQAKKKSVAALQSELASEPVDAMACSPDGKVIAVVTPTRVVAASDNGTASAWNLAEIHSVSVLPADDGLGIVALQKPGEPFSAIALGAEGANQIAQATRMRLDGESATGAWWDDPQGTLGVRVAPIGLVVRPTTSPIPEQQWCSLSFVNTGIQIRSIRLPDAASLYKGDYVDFVPWDEVIAVSVEGTDQIERRPSVGAVVAFGVLGLGASKVIRRAYVVVATKRGDYFFEYQGLLPAGLASLLGPVLRHFAAATAPDDERSSQDQDVAGLLAQTNQLLGEILTELRSQRTNNS